MTGRAPLWKSQAAYEDAGTGVPVVLIHAFPLHRGMWEPQRPLSGNARLIAYDVRGFGGTPSGIAAYPLELLVDDLFSLLDHLQLRSAVLCGLSMGGYIALRAAERSPERVRGLILCDTKSETDGDEARLKRAGSILAIHRDGLDRFADGFLKQALSPATLQRRPDIAARVRALILDNGPDAACAALLAMAGRTDTTAALRSMRAPALVVVGEQDGPTPPEKARAMAAALPNARLAVIPGAGHFSNLENPEDFNAAVSAFLARL